MLKMSKKIRGNLCIVVKNGRSIKCKSKKGGHVSINVPKKFRKRLR